MTSTPRTRRFRARQRGLPDPDAPQPCATPDCPRTVTRRDRKLCWQCNQRGPRKLRALLAEMVDAWDLVQHSFVRQWEELTPEQRNRIDAAATVSDAARAVLGVPWPLDCVRPPSDPATTPSPE
jgi:hypothetical protein